MDYESYYLNSIEDHGWSYIFRYILPKCDEYRIHMWGQPEERDQEFLDKLKARSSYTVEPWWGGDGLIEIVGALDEDVRNFFTEYFEESLAQDGYRLWDYSLISKGRKLLYIGDYEDRVITLDNQELEDLSRELNRAKWTKLDDTYDSLIQNKYKRAKVNNQVKTLDIKAMAELVEKFFETGEDN